jgi:ApaG protein
MKDKNIVYQSITENISISVVPNYEDSESNPAIGKFIYSYQVTIENLGNVPVKLLSRHWHIHDSIPIHREVKGEGVIGQQPIILPGEIFQYMSWSSLNSPVGKMFGKYTFVNMVEKFEFEVVIPEFLLVSDFKLN